MLGRGGHGKEDFKKWILTQEKIFLYSLPIKDFEIIDFFLGTAPKYEVLKIIPVHKQALRRHWRLERTHGQQDRQAKYRDVYGHTGKLEA